MYYHSEVRSGTNTYLVGTGTRRLLIDTGSGGKPSWTMNLGRVLDGFLPDDAAQTGVTSEHGSGLKEGRSIRGRRSIEIEAIILTHRHRDHVGGVGDALEYCGVPSTKVYKYRSVSSSSMSVVEEDEKDDDDDDQQQQQQRRRQQKEEEEEEDLSRPRQGIRRAKGILEQQQRQQQQYLEIKDGQIFEVEGARLRAAYTPGHTDDHVVLYFEARPSLNYRLHLKESPVQVSNAIITGPRDTGIGNEEFEDENEGEEEDGMFTGDNVLGQGTAVFEDLELYLLSLQRMQDILHRRQTSLHQQQHQQQQQQLQSYQKQSAPSNTNHVSSSSSSTSKITSPTIAATVEAEHDLNQRDHFPKEKKKKKMIPAYPGHGPSILDGEGRVAEYILHREMRERQVLDLLSSSRNFPSPSPHKSTLSDLGHHKQQQQQREEDDLGHDSSALFVSSHPALVPGSTTADGGGGGGGGGGGTTVSTAAGAGSIGGDEGAGAGSAGGNDGAGADRGGMTAQEMVKIIYEDLFLHPSLLLPAEHGLLLILEKLSRQGKVRFMDVVDLGPYPPSLHRHHQTHQDLEDRDHDDDNDDDNDDGGGSGGSGDGRGRGRKWFIVSS